MPIEFLHGQPLDPDELDSIRLQIEGFDTIEADPYRLSGSAEYFAEQDTIDPEIRAIVARNWPHLLAKLPPEDC